MDFILHLAEFTGGDTDSFILTKYWQSYFFFFKWELCNDPILFYFARGGWKNKLKQQWAVSV